MTLNEHVNQYIMNNFAPSEDCHAEVNQRYVELKELLGDRTFRTGSYKRGTSCRPVSDLDVIYRTEANSEEEALIKKHQLLDLLEKKYSGIARVEEQTHSIGIYYGDEEDFSIDIVPAYIDSRDSKNEFGDSIFRVPEISHKSVVNRRKYCSGNHANISWIKSDPKGYVKSIRVTSDLNNNFLPAVVLIKKWRRNLKDYLGDDFVLKSFHAELILQNIANNNSESTTIEIVRIFFESLIKEYLEKMPMFADRADNTRMVDDYEISFEQKHSIDKHAKRALLIIAQMKDGNITEKLEELVDPNFLTTIVGTIKKPHLC
jgi:Second Messenger Oligonucleotide or Dinucleotide Synthetase domain